MLGDTRPRRGRGHRRGAQGYALPGPPRAAPARPPLSSNSTNRPKFAVPPPPSPYLAARCTPRPEGSSASPGAAAALRPPRCRSLSAPLPPPAAKRTQLDPADPAGPGAPSLPAAEPSQLPASSSPPPPPARPRAPACDPRRRPSRAQRPPPRAPRPRSSPAAVTPPRGRPSPAHAGRGTHLGVPARPRESAACGL